MPGSGVISWSGPECARTRPARALYNPDGRHTYVGRIRAVGGVCIQNSFIVMKWIHLWPALAFACVSLSRSPFSQSRSDACTKMSRYRTLFGWLVWWSWYLLAIARGYDHAGAVFKDHLLICSRFSCSGLALN